MGVSIGVLNTEGLLEPVDVIAYGCLHIVVHVTKDDPRLAESKTDAFTVTHVPSGRSIAAGIRTKKAAIAFAERCATLAEEMAVDLSQSEPEEAWRILVLKERGELPLRKGFSKE